MGLGAPIAKFLIPEWRARKTLEFSDQTVITTERNTKGVFSVRFFSRRLAESAVA